MKYNDKTKLQLIELCKSKNIKNYSKLNKEQLIQLLNKYKNGGTRKNVLLYVEDELNKLFISEKNNNIQKQISFNHIKSMLRDYFKLILYFKRDINKDKDLLDYIIKFQKPYFDDLGNFINYKLDIDARPLDHWEYVISIIKKEKTISLLDFYVIWVNSDCNIYNEDKINYYKTIIKQIKKYKNNNQSKNFDDFMDFLKKKINSNNNLKEIFNPHITENLPSRLEEIKNKNLISDGYKRIIDDYIKKQKNNKFEYIELEKDHFIYNQLKDIWKGIDNKSFIEILTGISINENVNTNKIKKIYKIHEKIYFSENDFINQIENHNKYKYIYSDIQKVMQFYSKNDYQVLNEKEITQILSLKYDVIKKFKDKKYHNLLTAYYMKIFGSNNFGRFMSTKNIKTNGLPDFYRMAEINYYCKTEKNINSSDFLYKIYLIHSHQLIPDIRVKYYKKLHKDMLEYKNNTNNTNNFSSFMTYFKDKIKNNNFQIDEDYQLYITKFKYCKNKINNNKKKIDIMYKDLQKSTSIYQTWEKLYNKLSKNNNLTLKDFILDDTKYYLYCNNGLKYINKDNDNFDELYNYKIFNGKKNPESIYVSTNKYIPITKEYEILRIHIEDLEQKVIEINDFTDEIDKKVKNKNNSYKQNEIYLKFGHRINKKKIY